MAKKEWSQRSYKERIVALARIYRETFSHVKKEEAKGERTRRRLLGIGKREKIHTIDYNFRLSLPFREEDEPKVKKLFEEMGEIRYGNKPLNYEVWDTDRDDRNFFGIWSRFELRWPRAYHNYVDSIYLFRGYDKEPTKISITFLRGRYEDLRKEAEGIFAFIKKGLESIVGSRVA